MVFLLGCNTESVKTDKITSKNENILLDTLPQFKTLKEMLSSASDYYPEDGSLKFISDENSNIHIQISKPIYSSDSKSLIEGTVKRNIVYVAFQTFARTDINEIKITSIPNDVENRKKYYTKHAKTVKIKREEAKLILVKYLKSDDFSILYEKNKTTWLPSKKFSKLKYTNLDNVFSEMMKK